MTTRPEKRFSTPLIFYNINNHTIDTVDLWIRYDPELIDPVWIDVSKLEGAVDGSIQSEVMRSGGYIHLFGRLKTPVTKMAQTMATISWRARDQASTTYVELEAPADREFGLYEEGVNCLDLSKIGNRGRVSLLVRIVDESVEPEPYLQISPGVNPLRPAVREGRGVHLALISAQKQLYPGETSMVDVVLINPDVVPFDELRFRLRFDPASIEILDADENNYISRGLNIFDGGFHDAMPFEIHLRNGVDPERGVIEYAVRSAEGARPYSSGTIARIVFRMKREAGATTIWFEGIDPISGSLISDVRTDGRSLLGPATGRAVEGLHHISIGVAPL